MRCRGEEIRGRKREFEREEAGSKNVYYITLIKITIEDLVKFPGHLFGVLVERA